MGYAAAKTKRVVLPTLGSLTWGSGLKARREGRERPFFEYADLRVYQCEIFPASAASGSVFDLVFDMVGEADEDDWNSSEPTFSKQIYCMVLLKVLLSQGDVVDVNHACLESIGLLLLTL